MVTWHKYTIFIYFLKIAYLDSGCSWRVFHLVGFHPLVLRWKFSIQHREEGDVWIDGVRCRALLLKPGADYLRVGLHASLFVRDHKHFIWDQVEPVLSGLALSVGHVHDSSHVHVAEVVPASTWQYFQCRDGEVGGGTTLSEPVYGAGDGDCRTGMEEPDECHCCFHGASVCKS